MAEQGNGTTSGVTHNQSTGVCQYRPGERLRPEQVPAPRPNTPLEALVCYATLLAVFGLGWITLACLAWALWAAVAHHSALAVAVWVAVLADWMAPAGKRWPAFLHSWVWDTWRRHFRYRGVVPAFSAAQPCLLRPGRPFIFVHLPHAVFPMGSWLSFPLCGEALTGVPAPMNGLIATVLLRVPIAKHLFAWMGCLPADKAVMLRLLARESVGVIVEGVAGIFHGASPARERVFLRRRKGFVKVALQSGCELVPVYHLGSSQILTFSGNSEVSRRWRMSVGLYWGRWGLPLPRRHDIITLVGTPVPMEQRDAPTQAEVDALHARFVAATLALFQQHRHLLPGWERKELAVV